MLIAFTTLIKETGDKVPQTFGWARDAACALLATLVLLRSKMRHAAEAEIVGVAR